MVEVLPNGDGMPSVVCVVAAVQRYPEHKLVHDEILQQYSRHSLLPSW